MGIRSVSFALAVMLLLLVVVVGTQNPKFVSAVCNTEKIPMGSPFFGTLSALMKDLEENTANSLGEDYKKSISGSPTAYGEAYCTSTTSRYHCDACLFILGGKILEYCNNAIGAQVLYDACFVRYEQYSF